MNGIGNLVELEHAGLEPDAVALAALDVDGHAANRPDARHGERRRLHAAPLDQAPAGVLAVLEPHVARHVKAPAEAPHRLLGRRDGHPATCLLASLSGLVYDTTPAPQPCPVGRLLLVDYIGHCLCQQVACLGNSSDMLLLHAVRMSRTLFLVSDKSNRDLFLFFFLALFFVLEVRLLVLVV